MGADLDRILSTSLQQRAEAGSPIDPRPLLNTAVARGRRLRARRRVATTVLVAAAVAGVAAVAVWVPREQPTTPLDPGPSPSGVLDVDLAKLPVAEGQPGAAARPDLVGTDPALLHFSVDALAAAARRVTWRSEPGVETADVQRTDFQVFVALARSQRILPKPPLGFSGARDMVMSAPIDISLGGRDATLRTSDPWEEGQGLQGRLYAFQWQPVNGLWARADVQTTSQERAVQIAQQVRFDQARRCVVPVRASVLPASGAVPDCNVALAQDSPGLFSSGGWTVVEGKRRLSVQADAVPSGSGEYPRPLRAGPYRVYADPNGRSWTILVNGLFIRAIVETRKNPFTQAEVFQILGGLQIAGQIHKPETW